MNLMKHMLARAAAPLAIAAGPALAPSLATASAQTPAAPEQETAGIIVTLDSQASRQLNGHSGEDDLSLLADTDVMRSLEDAGLSVEGARTDAEGAALITAKPSEDMSDAEALARARSISGVAAPSSTTTSTTSSTPKRSRRLQHRRTTPRAHLPPPR